MSLGFEGWSLGGVPVVNGFRSVGDTNWYGAGATATATIAAATGSFSTLGDITLTAGGSILSTANGNIVITPNGSGYTAIGSAATSHTFNTGNDLFIKGRLEVDGALYADGGIVLPDDATIGIASGPLVTFDDTSNIIKFSGIDLFQVYSSINNSANINAPNTSGEGSILLLHNTSATANTWVGIRMATLGANPDNIWIQAIGTADNNMDLRIGKQHSADASLTEYVRIVEGGAFGIGTSAPDRLFHAEVVDATTNAVSYAQRLTHTVSGAGVGAAGLGVGIEFELETATSGTMHLAGTIETAWTTATAAAEVSDMVFRVVTGSTLTEYMRIRGADGSVLQNVASDTLCPVLYQQRARSGPAAVQTNDIIGGILCQGYQSGGAYSASVAYFAFYAAENFTATNQGTFIQYATTPIGSTVPVGVMKLMPDGSIQLYERTAPGVAEADCVKIFAVDNGAGKTQLMVRFQSGVAQQIAIEA